MRLGSFWVVDRACRNCQPLYLREEVFSTGPMEEEVRKVQPFAFRRVLKRACSSAIRPWFCRESLPVIHRRIHSGGKGAESRKITAAYTTFSVDNGEKAFRRKGWWRLSTALSRCWGMRAAEGHVSRIGTAETGYGGPPRVRSGPVATGVKGSGREVAALADGRLGDVGRRDGAADKSPGRFSAAKFRGSCAHGGRAGTRVHSGWAR